MRTRYVTRTIRSTKFDVMCLNVPEGKAYQETIEIAGTFKKIEDAKKAISEQYDTDEKKAVHIIGYTVEEKLYGMTENKFIEMAEVMPSRAKVNDEESED